MQIVTLGLQCFHPVDPGRNASVLGESVDLLAGQRAPEVFYDLSEPASLAFPRIHAPKTASVFRNSAASQMPECAGIPNPCQGIEFRHGGYEIHEKTLRADVPFRVEGAVFRRLQQTVAGLTW